MSDSMTPSYTFEIFPPKGSKSLDGTWATIDSLASLSPDLISVTYGAGGTSRENTVQIASGIQNKYGVNGVAHLTCVGSTKENIRGILRELKANNVRSILALRGDLKDESDLGEFHHASELIKFIIDEEGDWFDLFAACYPEKHPEAPSMEEDLRRLKEKCDIGGGAVKGLISQLFFDNDAFERWRDKARAMGIKQPIIAGIMPITNARMLGTTVTLSGTSVPKSLSDVIAKYGENDDDMKKAGIEYAIDQRTSSHYCKNTYCRQGYPHLMTCQKFFSYPTYHYFLFRMIHERKIT